MRDEIGPKRGARVVARAWRDPAFKARLLADGAAAIDEFGYHGHATGHLDRGREHAAGSTTSSSAPSAPAIPSRSSACPPGWYKSNEYRARAVRDPRGVLAEFGVDLGADVEVRVWDSTAELRYLVLPQRPAGTRGSGRGSARRPRHAQCHDRHRALISPRGAEADGRRSRSRRRAGLRPASSSITTSTPSTTTGKRACGASMRR